MAFFGGGSGGLDQARCIKLAIMHDIAEAIVGDITPHDPVTKARLGSGSSGSNGACRIYDLHRTRRRLAPGLSEVLPLAVRIGLICGRSLRRNRRRSTTGSSPPCRTCRRSWATRSGHRAARSLRSLARAAMAQHPAAEHGCCYTGVTRTGVTTPGFCYRGTQHSFMISRRASCSC